MKYEEMWIESAEFNREDKGFWIVGSYVSQDGLTNGETLRRRLTFGQTREELQQVAQSNGWQLLN